MTKAPQVSTSYKLGKSNSKKFYTAILFFKDSIPKEYTTEIADLQKSKIFSPDGESVFFDHANELIFVSFGDKTKFVFRKGIQLFFTIADSFSKWDNVGLQIVISKDVSDFCGVVDLVYQIANTLDIGLYPVNSLTGTYKEKFPKPGIFSFQIEDKKREKEAAAGLEKNKVVSQHLNEIRFIAHLPANHYTPEEFVASAKELSKQYKLALKVWDEPELRKEKLGGILSVCEGSDKKPKMIVLEYKHPKAKSTLALVGKGLTFDAGGISLKPASEMHEMKYDMCGAATALHAIGAIAGLKLEVNIITALGVAENMPDGKAIKPGDVYTAYNGMTVEVQNTDAEGRLVLGDVLSYITRNYKPDYVIDLATLTGAVIIALGHEAAGLMTSSDILRQVLLTASEHSQDRLWELPFWEEYGEDLKSDIADVRNITGGGKGAGTISASRYLSKFSENNVPYAHLDIAGTAWRKGKSGTQTSGPTGWGIRLLVEAASLFAKLPAPISEKPAPKKVSRK